MHVETIVENEVTLTDVCHIIQQQLASKVKDGWMPSTEEIEVLKEFFNYYEYQINVDLHIDALLVITGFESLSDYAVSNGNPVYFYFLCQLLVNWFKLALIDERMTLVNFIANEFYNVCRDHIEWRSKDCRQEMHHILNKLSEEDVMLSVRLLAGSVDDEIPF